MPVENKGGQVLADEDTLTKAGRTMSAKALGIDTAEIKANAVDGSKIAVGSDAQGDILQYGGTDYKRLGAGTAGQVLVSGGAGADNSWGTAGAMVLLGTTTLGAGATELAVGSLVTTAYRYLKVFVDFRKSADGTDRALNLTFNDDDGGNYAWNNVQDGNKTNAVGANLIQATTTIAVASDYNSLIFEVSNVSAVPKFVHGHLDMNNGDNQCSISGYWGNTASTITKVELNIITAQFQTGAVMRVYGIV